MDYRILEKPTARELALALQDCFNNGWVRDGQLVVTVIPSNGLKLATHVWTYTQAIMKPTDMSATRDGAHVRTETELLHAVIETHSALEKIHPIIYCEWNCATCSTVRLITQAAAAAEARLGALMELEKEHSRDNQAG